MLDSITIRFLYFVVLRFYFSINLPISQYKARGGNTRACCAVSGRAKIQDAEVRGEKDGVKKEPSEKEP